MGFRDDRDATRARAEALQRELDDALKELGRLQISHLEASEEAETLRKRVEELEKTRRALPRPAGGFSGVWAFVAMGVAVVVVSGATLLYLLPRSDDTRAQAAVEAANQRAAESAHEARAAEERRAAEEEARLAAERAAAELAAPEPAPQPEPAPAGPRRRVELTWPAKVVRAEGKALRRGARCSVQARLESDGSSLDAEVDVTCGGEVLYRWAQPLGSGMQMRDCSVSETAGPDDTFLHRLTCSDLGARTGRPQLSLDTGGHTAAVWSEAAPSFRVELAVSGDGRAPGPALGVGDGADGRASSFAPVDRAARVTRVSGTPPVTRGVSCRVRIDPSAGRQNCRTEVRCGATVLYGDRASNGFNACELADGGVVRARDDRGTDEGGSDPRLELDLPARRVVVSDGAPAYEVTLTLAP